MKSLPQFCELVAHRPRTRAHSLCLTDALPLRTGAAVEGVVDVQSQHFAGVGRLACGQGHVLVEQLEAVGQGQEGAWSHVNGWTFCKKEGATPSMALKDQCPKGLPQANKRIGKHITS